MSVLKKNNRNAKSKKRYKCLLNLMVIEITIIVLDERMGMKYEKE